MDNYERLIRTLDHDEPDRVLVHLRGVLPNGTYYQWFMKSRLDYSRVRGKL
ncbi:MAG: hypothetical protein ACTSWN_05575 [Promethearchaeota archaeon]